MTHKGPFRLVHDTARQLAASYCLHAPEGTIVRFSAKGPSQRSLDQNALMWKWLEALSEQLPWRDWQKRVIKMTPHEWKDFLTACFKREQRMVLSDDGREMILVGSHTSDMTVAEMGELLTFVEAFATQRDVTIGEEIVNLSEARRG